MKHKFSKGVRVLIVPLNEHGQVLHCFIRRVFAKPDEPRYTVQTEKGATYECSEDELSA